MKKFLFILLFSSTYIYASGSRAQTIKYIDLGEIDLSEKDQFTISLPYIKPQGVKGAPIYDILSIIMDKLVVDGKEIKGKKLFLSEKTFVDRLNFEWTSEKEEYRFMEMEWLIERNQNKERSIKRLVYESETGNTTKREQFIIPSGAKEIFLTYCIRIPIYNSDWRISDYFYTNLITVKWTIIWPLILSE